MRQTSLGKTTQKVSALGLGCMGMSAFYGSAADRSDSQSIRTIHKARESGIQILNTGDFYGTGHNEMLIGKALSGMAAKPMVSVKFGILRTPSGGFSGIDTRPEAVKNFAAYSLTRLGLEAIDIYQPARVSPAVPIEDTVGAVADLIKEGKVRFLGLSEVTPEQIRRAHRVHPVTAVEVEYSLATRVIEKELLAVTRELGITVFAYGALSRGLLSGGLPETFHPSDFRAHAPRFSSENLSKNKLTVDHLKSFAEKRGATAAQIAIAWVLHQGADIVPLLGTKSPERLEENLKALEIELSTQDLKELGELFSTGAILGDRYPSPQMGLVVQ